MAAYAGPEIVTNGLVLALDAGNTQSYPGSGTAWTDISPNRLSGTLTNGPTFSSDNKGAIVFDGVNDFIDFTSDANLLPTTGLSVSAWFKTSVADMWLVGKTSISTSNGYLLAGTGVGGITFQVNGINATSTASITNNSWIYIVGTWTPSTSILLYRNGSLIVTNTTSIPASITEPSYTVEVGRRPNGPDYWNGSIAQVSIYNRALSAAEIQQNFNALRGRFGI